MTSLWIFAAIGTATCFAISSLLAYDAARGLGAIVFSFVRMSIVAASFGICVLFVGFDRSIDTSDIALLIFSGMLGVLLSDTLRYASLTQVGPSFQSLLNTTTAPFTLIMGFLFLGQVVGGGALLGTAIVIFGLVLAVYSRNSDDLGRSTRTGGAFSSGILFGLASALTQAGSVIVAAPVMLDGASLISATFVRSIAGSLSLLLPVVLSQKRRAQITCMSGLFARQVLLSAVIGTGLGMFFQLYALANGPVGIVSALTATTPLIILPLIWMLRNARPPVVAWFGAVLAVVGVALIVNSD